MKLTLAENLHSPLCTSVGSGAMHDDLECGIIRVGDCHAFLLVGCIWGPLAPPQRAPPPQPAPPPHLAHLAPTSQCFVPRAPHQIPAQQMHCMECYKLKVIILKQVINTHVIRVVNSVIFKLEI